MRGFGVRKPRSNDIGFSLAQIEAVSHNQHEIDAVFVLAVLKFSTVHHSPNSRMISPHSAPADGVAISMALTFIRLIGVYKQGISETWEN
ncbi:hypothetical protein [Paeniglutamicibacter gangotriensis]|uniref:hypothetical protein n=1 Tax=Paeniglutamicibacter gangotriensis TaxID=254787 RepID=UPI00166005CB|nr:hypothetical protein [Paeniglutamicibacter gangotriensis]